MYSGFFTAVSGQVVKPLGQARGDFVDVTDGLKPAVFRVGEQYLYLVMPLAG